MKKLILLLAFMSTALLGYTQASQNITRAFLDMGQSIVQTDKHLFDQGLTASLGLVQNFYMKDNLDFYTEFAAGYISYADMTTGFREDQAAGYFSLRAGLDFYRTVQAGIGFSYVANVSDRNKSAATFNFNGRMILWNDWDLKPFVGGTVEAGFTSINATTIRPLVVRATIGVMYTIKGDRELVPANAYNFY